MIRNDALLVEVGEEFGTKLIDDRCDLCLKTRAAFS
jgi:hypothetical protein